MKKLVSLLTILLVLSLIISACSSGGTTTTSSSAPASSAAPAPSNSEAVPSSGNSAPAESTTVGKHEIYSLLPNSALSGVIDPDMPSRASIDKAWPKTPANPDKIVVGWSEITQDNDWFIGVHDAAQALSKQYGFQLNFMNANNDVNAQSQHIDTFISLGVDIIVVDPINVVGPVEDIKRAVAAGIPVICIGTVPDDCPILTTMAPNAFQLGYESGQYIAKQFNADEEIVSSLIIGMMGSSASEGRLCGMLAGVLKARADMKGKPYASDEDAWLDGFNAFGQVQSSGTYQNADMGFRVVGWGTGHWTIEGGLAAAEDLVTAHGNTMNLIMPDNDFMALGAITAIRNAGKMDSIRVGTSADGTMEGMDLIKSGELICTGAMSGPETGAGAIELINDIFKNGFDPNNLPMGSYFTANVITPENIDSFYQTNPDGYDSKFYKTPPYVSPKTIDQINANK